MSEKQLEITSSRQVYRCFLKARERLDKYFINNTALAAVGSTRFKPTGVVTAAVFAKSQLYLVGTRGSGKTLLMDAIQKGLFGSEGLCLRGDINMNLKDLYVMLNLDGKIEAEIYQIAQSMKWRILSFDELSRIPGIIQNQALNATDGYVEIRGKKYPLGDAGYMLLVATGNPPTNGEYVGAFDEDLALLDRIGLILDTDQIEPAKGDIFAISAADMDKNRIVQGNMADEIVAVYRYLRKTYDEDPFAVYGRALLMELAHHAFRYVTVNLEGEDGKPAVLKRLDKLKNAGWRDKLRGEHEGALVLPYCSDISIRTLINAPRLGFVLYKIAETESEVMKEMGMPAQATSMKDFIDAHVEAFKLALAYDRRFIPKDLPEALDMERGELLDKAFRDFRLMLHDETIENVVVALQDFFDALKNGDVKKAIKGRDWLLSQATLADKETDASKKTGKRLGYGTGADVATAALNRQNEDNLIRTIIKHLEAE